MLTITDLFDLNHSTAGEYLSQFTYPWEALAGISDLILVVCHNQQKLFACERAGGERFALV